MRNLARYLSAAVLAIGAWSGAQAQVAFNLAQSPLNLANAIAPNVLFALSVEFPTAITPAYTSGYSPTTEYLGYFDPNKCYTYNQAYTSAPTSATSWFYPDGAAVAHVCVGKWSGNFLNWVSMAGLDEFRFAMTGGTRVIDTTTNTVLQRSYQTNQGGNFGEKSISGANRTGATPFTSGTYYFNSSGRGHKMVFGTSSGSTSNEVWVQVKVCDTTAGLESNCTGYTNTSTSVTVYKPTGAVQNNSEGMRFGVFSYFNANSVDNAVMRAKMKFTGQYTYNASGVQSANALREWDPQTGIYVADPDSSDTAVTRAVTATRSGVVNYVNLFGTGSNSYKTYDVVGKLYYEALAYLRKRTLDSDFYGGAAAGNSDNFPVYSAYTEDPVQAYCQKNFIFFMGDTHTWCDKRLPGGSFTDRDRNECGNPVNDVGSLGNGDTLNVTTWTNNIQSGLGTTITENGASYYMSGMAYWAHINDIRPDLNTSTANKTTVTTYIIDVQEDNDRGVETQFWKAAKYGGFDTSTGATTPTSSSLPSSSNWSAYDTLYNGTSGATDGTSNTNNGIRPKTYLPAGNPLAMITAVNNAFSQISAATKGDAAVASSSGDLRYTGGAFLYQSSYTSVAWTGNLSAYSLTVVTSGLSVNATPSWRAATKLDAGNPSNTARVVYTFNDGAATYTANTSESATLSRKGIGFSAIADLSTAQRAALNSNIGGVTDSNGAARINYLRGDRTNEGTGLGFRTRTSLLGDIIHSQSAYVGAPTEFSFEPGFISFAVSNATRTPMLYVGANDGMLHGFNASASSADLGKEMMAYVPGAVVKNLNKLTSPNYSHQYYVDASPTVVSACPGTGGCVDASSWKTVLVSGLGAGGQGVFALDVTDPTFTQPGAGATTSKVMWEFTDRDDVDLGYTFGSPVIVKMNNGKWAAIFGNGYNNSVADGAPSTTGSGYLYIVFLSGPATNGTWTSGTHYIKLRAGTAASPVGTAAIANGLGSPVAIDSDLDGDVDYVYAGDMYGNVWKFDVTNAAPSSWATAFSGTPFFSARDAAGKVQPITGGLGISFSRYGGFMLNFGTGSYIGTNDPNVTDTQTLYGVLDRNDGTKPPTTAIGTAPTFRNTGTTNSLQQQTTVFVGYYTGTIAANNVSAITQVANKYNCSPTGLPTGATCVTVPSSCLVNYPGLSLTSTQGAVAATCPGTVNGKTLAITNPPVQLGWYQDLLNTSERAVADYPIVDFGTVDFVSLAPTGGACTGGLQGYEYILDVNTGGAPQSTVFDLTGSGIANSAQMMSVGGVNYVVGGRALGAGVAPNTATRMRIPSTPEGGGVGVVGGAGGVSQGCPAGTFVPGWGCVGVAGGMNQRSAQCQAGSGGGAGTCDGLFMPGQRNRLYWRQLFSNN